MGLKGLMTAMGMNGFALAGLLLSFALFVAVMIWVCTCPKARLEAQARLCIDQDDEEPAVR